MKKNKIANNDSELIENTVVIKKVKPKPKFLFVILASISGLLIFIACIIWAIWYLGDVGFNVSIISVLFACIAPAIVYTGILDSTKQYKGRNKKFIILIIYEIIMIVSLIIFYTQIYEPKNSIDWKKISVND